MEVEDVGLFDMVQEIRGLKERFKEGDCWEGCLNRCWADGSGKIYIFELFLRLKVMLM